MRASYRPRFPWITFNSILFSGYAIFDVFSFFWPSVVHNVWIILFYVITLLANSIIIYGLLKRTWRINYLIVLVSLLMVAHLSLFIFHPLGMGFAYIGPSRAFYTLFIAFLSKIVDERLISYWILIFNLVMICVHAINVFYFTRSKVAVLFSHDAVNASQKNRPPGPF